MYLHLRPEYGRKMFVRSVGNHLPDNTKSQPRTVLPEPYMEGRRINGRHRVKGGRVRNNGDGKEAAVMSGKWQRVSCLSWPPGLAISDF